ncbi:type IV secretory system conjugative DNA transfer family protein [bacterium]|nr:type IV secretory system conjugative DNA transfer family protein [bacterium]
MSTEYIFNDEIFAQVGPIPSSDAVQPGTQTEYSNDSYNVNDINNPWGWIIFLFCFLGMVVTIFFILKKKLEKKDRDEKASKWTLYEVRVPRNNEIEIGEAEKMFANLASIGGRGKGLAENFTVNNSISFEIMAVPGELRFYVHCPKNLSELVEKQILGSYQDADVKQVNDYNIFDKGACVEFARLELEEESYCPIRVAEDFQGDPLSNILSTLSKMSDGEGAMIQIVMSPAGSKWRKNGEKFVSKVESNNADPEKKRIDVSQEKMQDISKKISKVGFLTDIRIVASAPSKELVKMHLDNIVGAFSQFSNPGINKLKKKKVKKGERDEFMHDVIYRKTPLDCKSVLNIEELAALYHFPNKDITTPNIHWLLSRAIPASNEISQDINSIDTIWMGNNEYRGKVQRVCFDRVDRRRHSYILGQTGTGKSWLLTRMIVQDIYNGDGVCFIDPHGETAEMVLERIPPERVEDVIYFNAGDFERPFGLNIMEYYNEQHKHQVVNSFIALLIRMFDPHNQGYVGPMMQQAVRNSMLTVMSEEGSTLIEVVRVLQDEQWVKDKWLPIIKDEMVKRYWVDQVAKTDQKTKSESLGYFISKFDKFTTNLAIRNIIGQSQSSFDFRDVMDNQKILIINLSKGVLGEENMSFVGLLLVQKMLAAALSRQDVDESQRKDFFFYADEFQNFATDDFCSILSEARKYRLNLTMAHQYIGQLPDNIKDAVFGNVGSLFVARCSAEDGQFLEPQFDPILTSGDLINQGLGHYYVKMLSSGNYPGPFSLNTLYGKEYPMSGFDMTVNKEASALIKNLSRTRYGRDVNVVNADISRRADLDKEVKPVPKSGGFPPMGF